MATKKRKVKKNRSGAWTAVYVVLLTLWILFLAAVCLYILSQVWAYASVYDDTQKEPVIEAYVAKLRENVWDDSIAATVAAICRIRFRRMKRSALWSRTCCSMMS